MTTNLSNSYGEEHVRSLFDSIVSRYDLLNSLMSAGAHHKWRRIAVESANAPRGGKALDICCGTGDFAFELVKKMGDSARVMALDFSPGMIEKARQKAQEKSVGGITFVGGNALALPFEDDLFDVVTIGFGMRNLVDIVKGLKEMRRVLVTGGKVAILEIVIPQKTLLRPFFSIWFDRLVPRIGRLIYGSSGPYDYLPESVRRYPAPDIFAKAMESAGFDEVHYKSLGGGIIALHMGTKVKS